MGLRQARLAVPSYGGLRLAPMRLSHEWGNSLDAWHRLMSWGLLVSMDAQCMLQLAYLVCWSGRPNGLVIAEGIVCSGEYPPLCRISIVVGVALALLGVALGLLLDRLPWFLLARAAGSCAAIHSLAARRRWHAPCTWICPSERGLLAACFGVIAVGIVLITRLCVCVCAECWWA